MKSIILLISFAFASQALAADTTTKRFLLSALSSRAGNEIKIAAVKSLREYASDNQTLTTLKSIVLDRQADSLLRQEAVKVLAPELVNQRTSLDIVRMYRVETDMDVKVAILKSLYLAAAGNRDMQNFVMKEFFTANNAELQKAALFGLLASASNSRIGDELVRIAADKNLEADVRVEALKSLYIYNVRRKEDLVEHLAQSESEPTTVRVAALKIIQTLPQSSSKRDFLMNVVNRASELDVRLAALDALKTLIDEKDIQWFRLHRDPRSGFTRNPLLD